ncbi:beta strand repeat-containing protein, partial [Flaviaesturariibacter aridisoli]
AGPSALGGTNPQSVSTSGWDNGVDTKYWMIGVNTTGATNLKLSSLQGGSNTGPRDWKVQYRVGSTGTWNDVTGGTIAVTTPPVAANPATFFGVTDLALPAAAENQPLVQIRWVVASTVSVNNSTVASGGTSRMTAIYVKAAGGASTPVYVTGYQNLPVGNVTSYNVTGLAPNTTYYYVVRATNASGTSVNSNEITVTTAIGPSLTATTLTAFGNICQNVTSAANSFTITGSNLAAGNVTVGPLAGFAFSTTSGGTYSSSLTIPTTGGALSQTVFVQFTPTALQAYNGNIPVSGGGATAINVAASGTGANNAPTVTAGAATSVTNISATVPATISNNGCTAVTTYGVEYSTTSGFANGSGTQVPATNLAGGAFSVNLGGLTANTTYYYHSFATNGGGTAYSTQGSFTTAAGPVISLTASALAAFDTTCVGTVSAPKSFTITGTNLTAGNITVAATSGYQFATTATGPYSPALALAQPGGSYSQTVFVQFAPAAVQAYNNGIQVSGGGFGSTIIVNATGAGKVQGPTVVTLDSTNISHGSVSLRGAVLANGCSALTEEGIEWSTIAGFAPGTGTQVAAPGIPTGASYLVNLGNLVPGSTIYYRAYARNAGAIGFGTLKSVTLPGLVAGLRIWPVPVVAGQSFQLTLTGVNNGYHGIVLYNSVGAQVYRRNLFLQANYINERISLPASLAAGTYVLRVVNNDGTVASQTIVIRH